MSLMRRIGNLFSRSRLNDDIEAELRSHVEMRTEHNLRWGMSEREARHDALVRFGNVTATKERVVGADAALWLESVWSDLRYACRGLMKSPGFAATAVAVLALGVGVSVAIFAFADAVLIKPVPYYEPSRLVGLYESIALGPRYHLSYLDYVDWKRENKTLSALEAFDGNPVALVTAGGVEQVDIAMVTAGFLRTLGVSPILGRDFHEGDDGVNAPGIVLLSYGGWQKRYGGRRDVLGETVMLDGTERTIVGVLPQDFYFAPIGPADFWSPMRVQTSPDSRGEHGITGLGRLKDGVKVETAAADFASIEAQLAKQYPDSDGGRGATVLTLSEIVVGKLRPLILLLLSGSGLLLLIACVNVASLLLVRTQSRQREFALRGALGASRGRVVRQIVIEAMTLVVAGSVVGLGASYGFVQLLLRLIPLNVQVEMPYLHGIGLSGHVLWFAGAVGVLMAGLLSVTPLARISGGTMRAGLTEGGRSAAGTVWRHLGANLVVLELCTAVVLLVGAGLLGKSFYRLLHTEIGMEPDHLAMLRMKAPMVGYEKDAPKVALERRVMAEVGRMPGVKAVATAQLVPVSGGSWGSTTFEIVGRPSHDTKEATTRVVSANYFSVIEARLLRGRYFAENEDGAKPLVTIVNETFAKKFFAGEDPLGKVIRFDASSPPIEIVGVVEDIREGALDAVVVPALYTPMAQGPTTSFFVVARTARDPEGMLPELRTAVQGVDRGILTLDALSMGYRIHHSSAAYLHLSSAWLAGGFAAMALLLGVVGLYGVVAYSVSQRTREIGVRMALGAQKSSVYQLILKEAGVLVGVGIGAGLVCAVGAASLMGKMLYGTAPWDVGTLVGVVAVLGGAAMMASYLPARRAASVNPVEALRAE
jgi:macrolide transport system ATP-binding/permease protein